MGGNGPGRLEFAQDLRLQTLCTTKRAVSTFGRENRFRRSMGMILVQSVQRDVQRTHAVKSKVLLIVTDVLVKNDKEQFTVPNLVGKTQEYLEGTVELAYSALCMKEKLQELFGEKIVFITVNNRNAVTCSTIAAIIREFYKQPKVDDYEAEQTSIVTGLKKVWIRYDIPGNI